MRDALYRAREAARFWSKVDIRGPDECWPWLAGCSGSGYGAFWRRDRQEPAHRVAYELTYGVALGNEWGLHSCDNPICCNPRHVHPGDVVLNVAEAMERGRLPTGEQHHWRRRPELLATARLTGPKNPARGDRSGRRLHPERYPSGDAHWTRAEPERVLRGERNGHTKLTEDAVRAIRARHAAGETLKAISATAGTTFTNVSQIVRRETWKHVD
jgi:hypothetical protein